MILVDSEGNLMLDQCQWKSYVLSFTCKGSTSKLESVCDQDIRFSARYSCSPRWTRTWYRLGLQLILDAHAGLLRWFPRMRMSLGILGLFSTWLVQAPNLPGQVSQGWLTGHDDVVAPDRNNKACYDDIEVGLDLFQNLSNKFFIKCSLTSIALWMNELWSI